MKDHGSVVAFSTRVFLSNTLCCRPIIVISPSIQILGITGIERYPIPVAAHRIYGLEDTVVQWALSCFHPAFVRYPSLECFWKGGPGPAEPPRLCIYVLCIVIPAGLTGVHQAERPPRIALVPMGKPVSRPSIQIKNRGKWGGCAVVVWRSWPRGRCHQRSLD